MFKIVTGSLLESKETYLCHQCNCITNRSAHLAKAVFSQFPYADVYTHRIVPSEPGTIEIRGDGKKQRYVVALFAQYYPGKTKYANSNKDGWAARIKYFKGCLDKMRDLNGNFAFPWQIGCGAAGGDWDNYLSILNDFESSIDGDVTIYQLDTFKSTSPLSTLF